MVNRWRSRLLDQRPVWAIDVLVGDLDGDGRSDIVSGSRWYRAPDWEVETISGVEQAIALVDVDGDGALEVIGTRGPDLTPDLCWAKRSADGTWVSYDIGSGDGDWPHGVAWLTDHAVHGRALITAYHERGLHPPQSWGVPADPTMPWVKEDLADIAYSEEIIAVDLDGDGRQELVAGPWWLKWADQGWVPHRFADASYANVSRVRVADVDGDGRLDIILTEETGDWETRDPGRGRVTWFHQPADPTARWVGHVITAKKCPHSLDVADVDRDGGLAVIVGEHDAFTPEGEPINAELLVIRSVDPSGTAWTEEIVDTRFEHFCGAKAIDVDGGVGIVSHGWFVEPRPLVLWTREAEPG